VTPVDVPADKRFRRARVTPSRKRRWRPSWWTVARVTAISAVVAAGLYRVVELATVSEALTVTRITVQGNERVSEGEVLALLDGLEGVSLLTVDLEMWRGRLLASPWVADAAIRRMFPGTLAVALSERHPMGVGRVRGALYLVDRSGAVIDEFGPNYADLDLPVIDGLAEGGPDASVDEARAGLVSRLMADLQRWPELATQVSQIDVSDAHNAVVMLKGDTTLVRVGEERFAERLQSYLDLMPALRARIPDIDYVDLRFDERVYVRPLRTGLRAGNSQPKTSDAGARARTAGGD